MKLIDEIVYLIETQVVPSKIKLEQLQCGIVNENIHKLCKTLIPDSTIYSSYSLPCDTGQIKGGNTL